MDIIFLLEDLFVKFPSRIKKGQRTSLVRINRGYFTSLMTAECAIKAHAAYSMPSRLGFYIKAYEANPPIEVFNSQVKQYAYSANGNPLGTYQFDYPYHWHFAGAEPLWAVGDVVLFEECDYIKKGHVLQVPHTQQWFKEHAAEVEDFYYRLDHGILDPEEATMELEDVYHIAAIDDDHSIYFAKSACVFPMVDNLLN